MIDFKGSGGLGYSQSLPSNIPSFEKQNSTGTPPIKSEGTAKTEGVECKTCKSRRYQDDSNDPGVSFKAPGFISPGSSGAVVMSHEMEHVSNEKAKAKDQGREVISQSVTLQTSVCPECGRVYVSGGETKTTTAEIKEKDPFLDNYKKTMKENFGVFMDKKV